MNRRAIEVAAIAALLGIIVATYDHLFSQWRPIGRHPVGFLLTIAAWPWVFLFVDTLWLRGWHQLVALWAGLTINALLLLAAWRILKEARRPPK